MTEFGSTGISYSADFGQYFCTVTDVKRNFTTALTQMSWTDMEVGERIVEATEYIRGRLGSMGYAYSDLKVGTDTAPFIRQITSLYARYCCVRDLYRGNAPSQASAETLDKWKEPVNSYLDMIEQNKMVLVDLDGTIITPTLTNTRLIPVINTNDSVRITSLKEAQDWNEIGDDTNTSETVLGQI